MNQIELMQASKLSNWVAARNFFDLIRNLLRGKFEVSMHYLDGLFIYIHNHDYSDIEEEEIQKIFRCADKHDMRAFHYIDGLITIDI